MRQLKLKPFLSLFIVVIVSACDYDDADVMRPSSWAGIFVIAAILLLFYYFIKLYRKK